MLAQIVRSGKDKFLCRVQDKTSEILEVQASGKILKDPPVVGDLVELEKDEQFQTISITNICERKNELYRLLVRNKKKKVYASNVDLLAIVSSMGKPAFKMGVIERFYLRSLQWGIPSIAILNKKDCEDSQINWEEEICYLKWLGLTVYEVSALEGHQQKFDFEELKTVLKDKLILFQGQSGVGKSELISRLSNDRVVLKSNELAKKVEKGSHTTTWSEIVDCFDFQLIDSPGIRSLSIQDIDDENIYDLFPKVSIHFHKCQFTNCSHDENSKGCYFNQLDDSLESQFLRRSLESYKRIVSEILDKDDKRY